MLFTTYTYFLFFALVLAAYWTARQQRTRLWVLLSASVAFYASWSPPFVLLLFVSVLVDYVVSQRLPAAEGRRKRLLLLASVATNLGILATFKYADFLLDNAHSLLGLTGVSWERVPFGFVLPLGISFYTFQTMSYSIDVYRGKQQPMASLLQFSVYVTFFPQLVAGPIVRACEMAPQLESPRTVVAAQVYRGLNRIALGLVKKLILADWLATLVELVFKLPQGHSPLSNLISVYAYGFQIYLDFSGYCDIAIGSALLLGFRLPENFRAPYLAENVVDLWRRWHVTLSTWLRDYLYIPLGGNRRGAIGTYRNLILTMLLGGLWHGASWNFIAWGGLHGAFLVAHRLWRTWLPNKSQSALWRLLSIWLTFNLTSVAWIFFRTESWGQALDMFAQLGALPAQDPLRALALAPALLLVYAGAAAAVRRALRWSPESLAGELSYGGALGGVLLLVSLLAAPGAEFVYFQF